MNPKTFADFFGTINFDKQEFTGNNIANGDPDAPHFDIAAERKNARDVRSAIDRAAKFLAMSGNERAIETHNKNAARMASEVAQAWAMYKCAKCGRFMFDIDGDCPHCGHDQEEDAP